MYKQLYVEKIPAFKDWKEVYLEWTVLRIFLRRYYIIQVHSKTTGYEDKVLFFFSSLMKIFWLNQLIIKDIYIQFRLRM